MTKSFEPTLCESAKRRSCYAPPLLDHAPPDLAARVTCARRHRGVLRHEMCHRHGEIRHHHGVLRHEIRHHAGLRRAVR